MQKTNLQAHDLFKVTMPDNSVLYTNAGYFIENMVSEYSGANLCEPDYGRTPKAGEPVTITWSTVRNYNFYNKVDEPIVKVVTKVELVNGYIEEYEDNYARLDKFPCETISLMGAYFDGDYITDEDEMRAATTKVVNKWLADNNIQAEAEVKITYGEAVSVELTYPEVELEYSDRRHLHYTLFSGVSEKQADRLVDEWMDECGHMYSRQDYEEEVA